jgi:uncharacterized repeat protein (TIGR02543 family)
MFGNIHDNLKGNITYELNGGSFTENVDTSYVKGEEKELSVAIERAGYKFLGWYTDATFTTPVTKVPATANGEFVVYAKWGIRFTNSLDLTSGLVTSNMIECSNHTVENSTDGICNTCGFCAPGVDLYADTNEDGKCDNCNQEKTKCTCGCPFNRYNSSLKPGNSSTVCTKCRNEYKKNGASFCNFQFNDGGFGYANGVTLEDGKTPIIAVVSWNGGAQLSIAKSNATSLYSMLFNEDGSVKATQITYQIDLGTPTAAQCTSILGGKTFADSPATTPGKLICRIGTGYNDTLIYATGGKLSFTDNASAGFATLPEGTTSTYKIVVDFSEAVKNKGDGVKDEITIRVYDENGVKLGETTKNITNDISTYTNYLAQWRFAGEGAMMLDNIEIYECAY